MKTKRLYLVREYDDDQSDIEVHTNKATAKRKDDDRTGPVFCLISVEDLLGSAVAGRLCRGEVVEILAVIG